MNFETDAGPALRGIALAEINAVDKLRSCTLCFRPPAQLRSSLA